MSIVSRTNKYIFFHIPKCGGTSVSEILPNKESVKLIDNTHINYVKTKNIFELNNEIQDFYEFKKFTIIRNPIDRTISLFRYIKEHIDHHLYNTILDFSFTEFCIFLRNIGDESITSCYNHICDENQKLNSDLKIFKLEEINENLEEISNIVGKKITNIPHINKSNYLYKKTEESISIIKDIFRDDIEFFYKEIQ